MNGTTPLTTTQAESALDHSKLKERRERTIAWTQTYAQEALKCAWQSSANRATQSSDSATGRM